MTTPLQNNFFLDMTNYEIIICLISDYWGKFKKIKYTYLIYLIVLYFYRIILFIRIPIYFCSRN